MKRLKPDQVLRQNAIPVKSVVIHDTEKGNVKHFSFGIPKKYLTDDAKNLVDIYTTEEDDLLTIRAIISEIRSLIFDAIIIDNKSYDIFENEIIKCPMMAIHDIVRHVIKTRTDENHYHEKVCHNIRALLAMSKTDQEKEQKLYAFIWYFFERFTKK